VTGLLKKILGPETVLLDGGEGTARQTKNCLLSAGLLQDGPGSVQIENSSAEPALVERCMELLMEE